MNIQEAKELILKNVEEMGWKEDKVNHKLKDVELSLITEDEKDIIHIHIIIKNDTEYRMEFEVERNEKMFLDVAWNFICYVDDSDVYIFPYEFLKRKDGNRWSMIKYMKEFKNTYYLFNLSELGLMSFLIDRGYQNE